jgi:hypothetical protein
VYFENIHPSEYSRGETGMRKGNSTEKKGRQQGKRDEEE